MTKSINTLILAVIALFGLVIASFAFSPAVSATSHTTGTGSQSSIDVVCEGLGSLDSNTGCDTGAENKVTSAARTAINILSLIIGIASVIVIVVAGFRFIVSGGDSTQVQGARNSILYAVIGLVIAVMAQVIVAFVLTEVKEDAATTTTTTSP